MPHVSRQLIFGTDGIGQRVPANPRGGYWASRRLPQGRLNLAILPDDIGSQHGCAFETSITSPFVARGLRQPRSVLTTVHDERFSAFTVERFR